MEPKDVKIWEVNDSLVEVVALAADKNGTNLLSAFEGLKIKLKTFPPDVDSFTVPAEKAGFPGWFYVWSQNKMVKVRAYYNVRTETCFIDRLWKASDAPKENKVD